MFKREKEVVVDLLLLLAGLRLEHRSLHVGIVLLGVGRCDLHAANDELKHVDSRRIVRRDLGERAKLLGQMRDKGRLDERRFDELAENLISQFEFLPLQIGVKAELLDACNLLFLAAAEPLGIAGLFDDEVLILHLAPLAAEVDHLATGGVLDFGAAENILAKRAQEVLHERHHAAVVAVGLIDFEHGKLGVVTAGDSFVAEIAANLEDTVVTADQHALQIKLQRYAQHEIDAQRVVVRLERTGRRAAGDVLQNRSFDFEKIAVFEKAANMRNDLRARHEAIARLRVDDEVEITLAVNLLGIGQAAPFFWQRAKSLGDKCELLHAHGDLARLG